jgi:hypothetical protein
MGILSYLSRFTGKSDDKVLVELAGEMKLSYYIGMDGKPPFVTGTYSRRGVTFDMLNEKGYFDRWHPHTRIDVSVNKDVRDTFIVANRGRFYSRKLAEVTVGNRVFEERYVYLSSAPTKAQALMTEEIANWIINLDMPFVMQDGHAIFHCDRHYDNKERIKHITDALVYISSRAEKIH